MTAFLKTVPQGVPGDVSRPDESNLESVFLGATPPTAYGTTVKFDGSGNAIKIAASDTASVFAGFLCRVAPAISGAGSSDQFGASGLVPNVNAVQALLTRGYLNIVCTIGTPVRGQPVYVRVVAASGKLVGDLEATSDGSNNVALPNVTFAINGKDANNVTEVRVLG